MPPEEVTPIAEPAPAAPPIPPPSGAAAAAIEVEAPCPVHKALASQGYAKGMRQVLIDDVLNDADKDGIAKAYESGFNAPARIARIVNDAHDRKAT